MGSPVTGSDFDITNYSGGVCENFSVLINQANKLKEFFDWALTGDGMAITPEFAALFQTYFYPIGGPIWWPLSSVPANCVKADGRSLLRAHPSATDLTGYPELFDVFGTKYGFDDNTHFNVIDLRGKFLFGLSDNHVIGEVGGIETHLLSKSELPKHDHLGPNSNTATTTNPLIHTGNSDGGGLDQSAGVNGQHIGDGSVTVGYTSIGNLLRYTSGIVEVGSNTPHQNMPPYLTGMWLIKAR